MINGRTENGVWVAHFAPNPYTSLPMLLNATNRKRLVKQFPECDGYPARLENVPVRLTKEKTRDVQDGGETWGLRISKIPASPEAAPAQRKVITEDKIQVTVDWAKKGGKTFEDIENQFDFESDAVKQAVIDAMQPEVDDLP